MIGFRTMLKSADNTGAKKLQCITILGGYKKRYARVGDLINVVVKEALPRMQVKKGEMSAAVVLRTRKETRRPNGVYIRFDENACALVDKKTKEPKGTRIFGPVAKELKARGFNKIISLAPEVL